MAPRAERDHQREARFARHAVMHKDRALRPAWSVAHKDPYVRQSMSAIYEVIATIGPEHNQVLLACTDGLIKAATDEKPRIRYNALIALSQNPAGPPPAAHAVLTAALGSSDARARGISALGLLREGGHGSPQNEVLVAQALTSAQDSETRNGILHAISSANVKSQPLYDASAKFLSDGTPEIQQAAIDAVAASTQPAQAITALQNVASAPSVTKENKEYAVSKIEALKQTK